MDLFPFTQPANSSTFSTVTFQFTFSDIGRRNGIFCSLSRNFLHFHLPPPQKNTYAKHVFFWKWDKPILFSRMSLRVNVTSTEIVGKGNMCQLLGRLAQLGNHQLSKTDHPKTKPQPTNPIFLSYCLFISWWFYCSQRNQRGLGNPITYQTQ